jgi:hypothetical protein
MKENMMARPKIPLAQRLKMYVSPTDTGCWEWNGGRNSKGYGRIKIDGKRVSVHRVVYELLVGPIPDGMFVCHTCDNPCCCNPDHLFIGTNQDNVNDMVSKGRQYSKLAKEDVIAIKQIYRRGNTTKRQLAEMFDVDFYTIKDILDGTTWKHVNEGDDYGC